MSIILNLVAVTPTGREVIDKLLIDPGGTALFRAILAPCKFIAGLGVLYQFLNFLTAGGFSNLENLLSKSPQLVWGVVIIAMISGGGDLARNFGIANYAVIIAINDGIVRELGQVKDIDNVVKSAPDDQKILDEVRRKADNCKAIPPFLYTATAAGTPNPEFEKCDRDLRTYVGEANAKVNSADVKKRLATALTATGALQFADEIRKATISAIQNTTGATFEFIFAGWVAATGFAADQAILVSMLAMPIPLALSVFNPEPLKTWIASFWAVGIFKFNMTILIQAAMYFNGVYGAGGSEFFHSIMICLFAPAIAAIMAAGGGIAVMKGLGGLAIKSAEIVVEVSKKVAMVMA
jgi:hypothetical protein